MKESKIIRCRVCGRVWETKAVYPRCSNRCCRSTSVHELGYMEIKEMISNLERYIKTPDDGDYIEIGDDYIEIVD